MTKFFLRKGDWALGYASSQLWDFTDISWFCKILSSRSFGNLWGNVHTIFIVLETKSDFNCGESNLYYVKLFHYLVLNIVWNFFCSLRLWWWFKFIKELYFFLNNKRSIKKASLTKVEGFQMSLFDLSQTCKKPFTEIY